MEDHQGKELFYPNRHPYEYFGKPIYCTGYSVSCQIQMDREADAKCSPTISIWPRVKVAANLKSQMLTSLEIKAWVKRDVRCKF